MQVWGSHGDIRPMLALAEGLQAAGNEVHLVITSVDSDAYRHHVSPHGLRISLLASPVVEPSRAEEFSRIAYAMWNPVAQMATLLRQAYAPVEDRMFEAARQLSRESDLLIGHYFMHPLQIAAQEAGRPYVSVLLSHAGIPSAFNHPFGNVALGKTVHRLLWRLVCGMLDRVLLPYPNRLRRQLGMAPVHDMVRQVWLSDYLTLAAVSPRICHAQPDWPAAIRVCGFLDTPQLAIEGEVPAALAAFLDAGEAPVYMTFGSWMPKDRAGQTRTLQLLTQAARLAGCRAIIQSDAAADCGFASDAQICYVAMSPHQAIFPRCRAIVHHGGAGTTQAATLAGKPSVIVAHISEQEHWASELRRLGITGRLARRRSLSAAGLARRIRQVLATPAMTARAQEIGAGMREEDGVAEAVALIVRRAERRPAPADMPLAAAGTAAADAATGPFSMS
ncbi:glycosyltransferase [Massilia sp. GCM10023247]|uniref:glycosyltransferase n=1 Tax=Massilia sp. GCM10023247 TaxID=3252643 RepID=UPI0036D2799C